MSLKSPGYASFIRDLAYDAFPFDATESIDTDSDGTGNNTDADDEFPLDETQSKKSSGGGSLNLWLLFSLFASTLLRRVRTT